MPMIENRWIERLSSNWVKVGCLTGCLLAMGVAFYCLFTPSDLGVKPNPVLVNAYSSLMKKDSSFQTLAFDELKKVTEEIKQRQGNIDTWFHYKFVFLGGIFLVVTGGLGSLMGFAHRRRTIVEEHELQGFLSSQLAHCVLGLACVIAVTVDMHIRHEIDAIMTLGNWLAYYAEPALSGMSFQEESDGRFLFWENFLRAQGIIGTNTHTETVLGKFLGRMPHLFFLTLLLYMSYVWTLQNIICARAINEVPPAIMVTFMMVAGAFLMFGILSSKTTSEPLWWAILLILITLFSVGLIVLLKKLSGHPAVEEAESAITEWRKIEPVK